ncbi:nucleotide exchange factor GrpE [bacterium]|nr:nucleotide exchange factor GrpE [candidate division CSSED10-310 bacterium]
MKKHDTETNTSGSDEINHESTPNNTRVQDTSTSDSKDLLEAAESKAREYLDALQRLKAEFDNYRKRNEKERQRLATVFQASVIEAILPTLDAFDAAFKTESGNTDVTFKDGMRLLYNGLMDTLFKMGLEKIDVLEKPYDPEVAEATVVMPSDKLPEDHVMQELVAGYKFRGDVLRHAKVIVSASVDNDKAKAPDNKEE